MSRKTEEPSYNVSRTLERGVEIREYDSQIRASTQMGQENRSFGILAEYIFGHNDHEEKIGMTAPVITSKEKMSFVMPHRYRLESLPKPLSSQIKIHIEEPQKLAVLRFSGFSSPAKNEEKINQMLEILKEHGIKVEGEPFLMRYNPPWTIPTLRRNEVAVEVVL